MRANVGIMGAFLIGSQAECTRPTLRIGEGMTQRDAATSNPTSQSHPTYLCTSHLKFTFVENVHLANFWFLLFFSSLFFCVQQVLIQTFDGYSNVHLSSSTFSILHSFPLKALIPFPLLCTPLGGRGGLCLLSAADVRAAEQVHRQKGSRCCRTHITTAAW